MTPPVKVSTIARQLGVTSQCIRNWIKAYGIEVYATPNLPKVWHEKQYTPKTQRRSWTVPASEAKRLITIIRSR